MTVYNQTELTKILCNYPTRKVSRRAITKALDKAGIPYKQGIDGVFTTHEAINKALLGEQENKPKKEIELVF